MKSVSRLNQVLDEALVNLGSIVLRLADPAVTRTPAERRALAESVQEFSRCAERSADPRVHVLREKLKDALKPKLQLVSN